MPDCWQDTLAPATYAQALAQAILGNTLPQGVNRALAEFVKEPYLPS
jgi:hypothetical protein